MAATSKGDLLRPDISRPWSVFESAVSTTKHIHMVEEEDAKTEERSVSP